MSDRERCRALIEDRRSWQQVLMDRHYPPKDLRCKKRAVAGGLCRQHANMKPPPAQVPPPEPAADVR